MVNAATATNFQDKVNAALEEKFSQQQQAKDTISALSLAFSGIPDCDFLTEYALAVSKVLDADYLAIARLNPYSNLVRSLRFVVNGEIQENISYSLDGTPCARAVDGNCCIITENVAQLFPRDQFLQDNDISAYSGVALKDQDGNVIGVVVAMTKHKQERDFVSRTVLEHFVPRLTYCIASAEKLDRYSWAISHATDGIWEWDVVTGGTVVSEGIEKILGYPKGKGPYDLAEIEKAIHKDDLERHKTALRTHLCKDEPFDVRVRIKNGDGQYHWYLSRGQVIRDANNKPVRMIGCYTNIHDVVER